MKKLPEVKVSFGPLYRMLIAPIRSKLLLTSIELKVFNHLSKPKPADAVAKAISTHPKNTRAFLDGLTAMDLLQKRKGLYKNSLVAQGFLVEDSPTYFGQVFTYMARDCSLENLFKLIKEGPPTPPETSPFSEDKKCVRGRENGGPGGI